MRNERGFTLIEMLIVLLIISVLILVMIPNVTKHFKTIDDKGCDAYIAMVQSQVEAYKIDFQKYPDIEQLQKHEYLPKEGVGCPNGNGVAIDTKTGEVTVVPKENENPESETEGST